MIDKEPQYIDFWFIKFNIKKYLKLEHIIDIINQIDNKIIGEEKIYKTNIIVKIIKSNNTQNDYICKTNILCENIIIKDYLTFKFKQIQNLIKFYNSQFGFDWEINFELI